MSIFGVSMGVPSINLIRNEKQVDFAALFDFPALYPHELTLSGLHRLAGQLMSDREKKQQILDMHAKICSLYSACCDEVKTKYII